MRSILALAVLFSLIGCSGDAPPDQATVEEVWIRLPVVAGRPAAAYFRLRAGDAPIRLQAVTSPKAGRIELHDSVMDGNVMRMRRAGEIALAANGEIAFEPGGKHAMLFDLDPALKPGDRVPLSFTLSPATDLTVEAEIRGADAQSSAH